jgi:hypothetical protein
MHSLPNSLSPCAVMAIFDDPLTRCSHLPWLQEVLPDTARQLQIWKSITATSPLVIPDIMTVQYLVISHLVTEHLRMQVCVLQPYYEMDFQAHYFLSHQPSEVPSIPETSRTLLTDRLCASLLFGAPNVASCENGSEIIAFSVGLNTKLFPGMVSFKVIVNVSRTHRISRSNSMTSGGLLFACCQHCCKSDPQCGSQTCGYH